MRGPNCAPTGRRAVLEMSLEAGAEHRIWEQAHLHATPIPWRARFRREWVVLAPGQLKTCYIHA